MAAVATRVTGRQAASARFGRRRPRLRAGSGDAAILCAFNIAPLPGALPLAEDWALLDGYGLSVPARRAGTVQLPPYGFLFAGRVGN